MEKLLGGLRAAAEPTRLRLLALCAHGELSVGELTQILGQSQPRVSRHLKLLCDAGLLERFREGTSAFFHLANEGAPGRLAQMLVDTIPAGDAVATLDLERLAGIKQDRAAAAAKYFRAVAPKWDEVRSLYVDEREVESFLLDLVPADSGGELLDIGTGTGRIVELLAPHVDHAIGVDLSRSMLAFARAKLEGANLPNASIRQSDMYQLPWQAGSFDFVTIHQVLHFADEPANVIAEAARVLRLGGQLIVVDFAPHDQDHLRTEHAHRRLGFGDDEVAGWCRRLGLEPNKPIHLPGDPLTVAIWSAKSVSAKRPQLPVRLAAVDGEQESTG